MKTNDLKKGTRIRLANGWYATLTDNGKGNIREAEVEGFVKEIGTVYSHDIVSVICNGVITKIEHTPAQLKLKKLVSSF